MGTDELLSEFDMETFWRDEKTADVHVGTTRVCVKRYTTHPAKQLFHTDEISRFELGDIILKSRCFDPGRPDRSGADETSRESGDEGAGTGTQMQIIGVKNLQDVMDRVF